MNHFVLFTSTCSEFSVYSLLFLNLPGLILMMALCSRDSCLHLGYKYVHYKICKSIVASFALASQTATLVGLILLQDFYWDPELDGTEGGQNCTCCF